jgi:hypothetical protein
VTALSYHFGLNCVNPEAYGGWEGPLTGCHNDAADWAAYAQRRRFNPTTFLDDSATRDRLRSVVREAAEQLVLGDTFLLTYSGHGGQVPDLNGDEDDGADETLCLFDGQLLDDELDQLLSRFGAGVKVIVVSDSCHSGTVTRDFNPFTPAARHRSAPREACLANVTVQDAEIVQVKAVPTPVRCAVRAKSLLLAACADNQTAGDGERNGVFTAACLDVLQDPQFRGDWHQLRARCALRMPSSQSPQLLANSAAKKFTRERPFTP